jgi:hypothetical protein
MRILRHPFTLAQQRAIMTTGDVALINRRLSSISR